MLRIFPDGTCIHLTTIATPHGTLLVFTAPGLRPGERQRGRSQDAPVLASVGLTASLPSRTENKLSRMERRTIPITLKCRRGSAAMKLILASLLFAVAFIGADGPSLLTAVLPGVPAVLAPIHPGGLGDDERAIG